MVKGAWWAAAVQPVMLSLGTVLTVFDFDILDDKPNWLIFKNYTPWLRTLADVINGENKLPRKKVTRKRGRPPKL